MKPEEREPQEGSTIAVVEPEFPRPSMVKIDGKSFRCTDCNANVFTETSPGRYTCNGCGSKWIGE